MKSFYEKLNGSYVKGGNVFVPAFISTNTYFFTK